METCKDVKETEISSVSARLSMYLRRINDDVLSGVVSQPHCKSFSLYMQPCSQFSAVLQPALLPRITLYVYKIISNSIYDL